MRVSAHCADAFLNVSFSGFYRTGVRRLRPVRRKRILCDIRNKLFGTLFVSTPLCGDSCAILIKTKALLWGVSNAHLCAKTATCAIKNKSNIAALRVLYHVWYGIAATECRPQTTQPHTHQRPIAYEHRPTRGRSTAVEPVV